MYSIWKVLLLRPWIYPYIHEHVVDNLLHPAYDVFALPNSIFSTKLTPNKIQISKFPMRNLKSIAAASSDSNHY